MCERKLCQWFVVAGRSVFSVTFISRRMRCGRGTTSGLLILPARSSSREPFYHYRLQTKTVAEFPQQMVEDKKQKSNKIKLGKRYYFSSVCAYAKWEQCQYCGQMIYPR